jgi:hypothetical protein
MDWHKPLTFEQLADVDPHARVSPKTVRAFQTESVDLNVKVQNAAHRRSGGTTRIQDSGIVPVRKARGAHDLETKGVASE